MSECTEERFLKDVAEHTMTIVRDDGVNRHLSFSRGNSSVYRFDILTWPGHLCVTGDCGTYVFRRLCDMFEFFRAKHTPKDKKLAINPQYWAQKTVAQATDGGIHTWSPELFEAAVKKGFDEFFAEEVAEDAEIEREAKELGEPLDARAAEEIRVRASERDRIWGRLANEVLSESSHKNSAIPAAGQFRLGDFHLKDFLIGGSFEIYSFHFLWNCYAIAYAMQAYDTTKKAMA